MTIKNLNGIFELRAPPKLSFLYVKTLGIFSSSGEKTKFLSWLLKGKDGSQIRRHHPCGQSWDKTHGTIKRKTEVPKRESKRGTLVSRFIAP